MNPLESVPTRVRIVEVGPRDGLQNVATTVATPVKLEFIAALAAAGLREIEATSFVAARAIPQLADADEVFAQLPRSPDVVYSALVPNERGMRRAISAGARAVAVFTAASETFVHRNMNLSIEASLTGFAPVFALARSEGIPVRGYVSTAFHCPFEGPIAPQRVASVVARLLAAGATEVSLGDTIGAATPGEVQALLDRLLRSVPADRLAVHFHDTRGTALANVLAALQLGVSTIDASAGGLGGCPFAPGAAGNLATEDLVYMLDGMRVTTGVSLEQVCRATARMSRVLGNRPSSKLYQAWAAAQTSLLPTVSI